MRKTFEIKDEKIHKNFLKKVLTYVNIYAIIYSKQEKTKGETNDDEK